jgi:hypothetical protein
MEPPHEEPKIAQLARKTAIAFPTPLFAPRGKIFRRMDRDRRGGQSPEKRNFPVYDE